MPLILYPFSLVYGAASSLHRKTAAAKALPRPVISIGNITWGGTGKTPLVIRLAEDCVKKGLHPAVLSRGYGKKSSGSDPYLVSDGQTVTGSPEEAGDEPFEIAREARGTAVVSCPDRYAAARYFLSSHTCDLFILDDGFQHWGLKRDMDIVCVNALNPFGNGLLIPAGILREKPDALARAGMIVLTNTDIAGKDALARLESVVRKRSGAEILKAGLELRALRNLADGSPGDLPALRETKCVLFSALGNNQGFLRRMRHQGFAVAAHRTFTDHHWFTVRDITDIFEGIPEEYFAFTSSKDAVKLERLKPGLPEEYRKRIFYTETRFSFGRQESLWQRFMANIPRSFSTVTEP